MLTNELRRKNSLGIAQSSSSHSPSRRNRFLGGKRRMSAVFAAAVWRLVVGTRHVATVGEGESDLTGHWREKMKTIKASPLYFWFYGSN